MNIFPFERSLEETLSIRSVIENITEAAVITTLDGDIVNFNSRFSNNVPGVLHTRKIEDVFEVKSTDCSIKNIGEQVSKRSGLFPVRLAIYNNGLQTNETSPAYVSMLKSKKTKRPAALIYQLDEQLLRFTQRLRQINKAKSQHIKLARRSKLEATTDALTQLKNRRFVQSFAELHWYSCLRGIDDAVLVIFDIDHFKKINDTYGHEVGDEVIKAFAKCLKDEARAADVVGRWGGEEFIVILTKCTPQEARIYLHRAMNKIRWQTISNNDYTINITASAGYCAFSQVNQLEHVFQKADDALYKAKNSGRDTFKMA
ncbi:GGDEF domain-containing protein [Alteromonas sp. A079]|uniref:GGDEF domain-containing protein n=1 Tax=Alteromonas sp. A079 TaxID=3410268 RepID=UPI003BA2E4E9